jgi:hypothetical protein
VLAIAKKSNLEKRLVLADRSINKAMAQTTPADAIQTTSSKKMRKVGGIPVTRV